MAEEDLQERLISANVSDIEEEENRWNCKLKKLTDLGMKVIEAHIEREIEM